MRRLTFFKDLILYNEIICISTMYAMHIAYFKSQFYLLKFIPLGDETAQLNLTRQQKIQR